MISFTAVLHGQTAKRSLAHRYYSRMEYYRAAPVYDDLARREMKRSAKGKAADWESVRRAARSNFFIRNYRGSAGWFDALHSGRQASREDYMMYFEALRYLGEYDRAKVFLDSLVRMDPRDTKAARYLRESDYVKVLKRDSGFYTVNELPFSKAGGDFGPSFYGNEGLVFASSRKSGSINKKYGWDGTYFLNIFHVSRSAGGDYGRKAKLFRGRSFRTGAHDGPVSFSADVSTAFITRNRSEKDVRRGDVVPVGLYISQKGSDGKWGEPQPFAYNSKSYNVGQAALSPDGNTLYVVSDMPGGLGGTDIWKCTRQGGGWSAPENLGPQINTSDDEMFPYVSPEGHLYFSSKGWVGLGGFDVFECRSDGSGGFMPPVNMGYPLNTQFDDFALITEAGGKKGYFSSDRKDFADRIYSVDIRRIFLDVEGVVVNSENRSEKIPGARVVIYNKTYGDSTVLISDSSGRFLAPLSAGCDYRFSASKERYTPVSDRELSTRGSTESARLKTELELKPAEAVFTVRVSDCETGGPIVGLDLLIEDLETGKSYDVRTDEKGEARVSRPAGDLPSVKEFAVISEGLGKDVKGAVYRPDVKKLYFVLKGNETDLRVEKDICFTRTRGGDEVMPLEVYFDFDKWNLRPESKRALDKVYEYLKENPDIMAELSAHTDSRGSHAYNMALSEKRAKSCVDYLVKVKGIPAGRLSWKGYGETRPVNGCTDGVRCSEEEHQKNRRTEIRYFKNP